MSSEQTSVAAATATSNDIYFVLRSGSTSNGDGNEITIKVAGLYLYTGSGTYDGATIQLKHQPVGHSAFQDVGGAVLASGIQPHLIYCSVGDRLKDTQATAGGSTSTTTTLSFTKG